MTASRLRFRNPIALLFSPAPWTALCYLLTYLLVGSLSFALAFAALVTGATLSITWLGLPVLAAALATVRLLADGERVRIRTVGVDAIPRPYRPAQSTGLRAGLRERLRDPATTRDAVLLVALWVPLFVLDTVTTAIWLAFAATITLPVWYRYVPQTFDNGTHAHGVDFGNFPNGPNGGGSWGLFVDDMGSALLAAGVGAVLLVLVGNYLLVAAARAHARVAASLLRQAADPLAAAKQLLKEDPALSRG